MSCSVDGAPKRIMPPTYFFGALAFALASRPLLPSLAFANAASLAGGVALLLAGIALNLTSDSAFKRRGTPVSPSAKPLTLVQDGVFRVTRNPMYLGMVAIVAAAALLVGAPAGVSAAIVLLWVLNRFFVPREERALEREFGTGYADYRAAVPRWL